MPSPLAIPAAPAKPSASTRAPQGGEEHLVERRTLRDYYVIIRERLWIALPLALLVSLGLGYWKMRETPMYESRATLQFEREERVMNQQKVVELAPQSEVDINTYVHQLNSGTLRSRVYDSFTPEEKAILQRSFLKDLPPGAGPPATGDFMGQVVADAVRGSRLIRITARHRDPAAAALVANRTYQQFVNQLIENAGGSSEFTVEFLQRRATELRKELEEKEALLQDYKKRHNLISLDASLNIVADQLRQANEARTAARHERLRVENLFRQVEAYRQNGRDLLELSEITGYGNIPALRNQLSELLQTQKVLSDRYLERHPRMIELARQIATVRADLEKSIQLAVADLSASLEKARDGEQTFEKEYAQHEKDQIKLNELKPEYGSLENEALAKRTAYLQVLDRLNQTTTSKNLDSRVPLRVIDRATPSHAPYTPNLARVVRTSTIVGLLIFFGVAFGLSVVDDRIKSAWDVESYLGVHLLGIIPELAHVATDSLHTLAILSKATPGVESFLSVYSAVKIQSKIDYPKVILVTSTIPGEGKTLVSCNLAGSFARHGRSTLIIDCDMRRPMLHRHFKMENDAGLLAWAEAGASLDGDLTTDPKLGLARIADNLMLLRSGGRSKVPTELLEKPEFGELILQLKKRFDLIVIDSPPLGAVTDSLLIAEQTDEVIYVCRFNRALRKHIKVFVRTLREGKNAFLGIVLNGLTARRIAYYTNYRYYRSYKKYYGTQG